MEVDTEKKANFNEPGCSITTTDKNETTIPVEKIFGNLLVTDSILKNLDLSEINTISLVSKGWNAFAGDFLRRKRQCLLKCNYNDLSELQRRHAFLSDNPNHRYVGVSIWIDTTTTDDHDDYDDDNEEDDPEDLPAAAAEETRELQLKSQFEQMINLLTIKHVKISYDVDSFSTSEIFKTLEYLFSLIVDTITLEITDTESVRQHWTSLFKNVEPNKFANLKSIKVNHEIRAVMAHSSEVEFEAVFRACPNLLELQMPVEIEQVKVFYRNNKLFLIKWLRLCEFRKDLHLEHEALAILKMEGVSLRILEISPDFWHADEFNYLGQILTGVNVTSLRELKLRISTVTTIDDHKLRCPTLPDLQLVTVAYTRAEGDFHIREETITNSAHLSRIFPNARLIAFPFNATDVEFQ